MAAFFLQTILQAYSINSTDRPIIFIVTIYFQYFKAYIRSHYDNGQCLKQQSITEILINWVIIPIIKE